MDVKLGTRQYGDDASPQKRLSQTQKCILSTSEQYGVRMVGMQIYEANSSSYSYVTKYEGRKMDQVAISCYHSDKTRQIVYCTDSAQELVR